jgi:flagellar motor component MotA
VNDRQIVMAGGIVGALAGMAAGYMFFTPSGQRWRQDAERNLTTFMQEAERLLSAADQVRQSVAEIRGGQTGWAKTA